MNVQLEEIILSLSSHAPMLLMALIDLTLKGSIVLLAAGIVILTLRRLSASHRHMIWSAALTAIILLPLLGLILPSWQTPLIPAGLFVDSLGQGENALAGSVVSFDLGQLQKASGFFIFPKVHWTFWPVALWLLGATGIAIWMLAGKIKARAMIRSASKLNSGPIRKTANEIADRLDFGRDWKLMISDKISVPMAIGSFKHMVLLPADAPNWPLEKAVPLLTHEMIHIKRRDVLLQWSAILANALYWFNPLVWLAGHRQFIERELACDDQVLNTGIKPSTYADCLLEAAGKLTAVNSHRWATTSMARGGDFKLRMKSILNCETGRKTLTLKSMVVTLAIAAFLTGVLAAWSPWAPAIQNDELPATSIEYEIKANDKFPPRKTQQTQTSKPAESNIAPQEQRRRLKVSEVRTEPEATFNELTPNSQKKQVHTPNGNFTIIVNDKLPDLEMIHWVEPEFPAKARETRKTGSVNIEVLMDKEGKIVTAKSLNCSTPGFGFEESAVNAVKQWKFKPIVVDGKPVKVRFRCWVNFKLVK